ncbi:MAG: Ppx/GppA family phosphatase [Novosphingobium sp.]
MIKKTASRPARHASANARRAIIDVGSNSIRLVIYEGPARTPFVVHNEKVQARLGRSLSATGRIDEDAFAKGLAGCRRFKALVDAAGISDVRTVATAAAREAENGPQFLDAMRAIGLEPQLLSGDEEALQSAAGVISAFPGADGIVGDLGGGSLELIDVRSGVAQQRTSLPLGVLRLAELRAKGDKALRKMVMGMLRDGDWLEAGAGRPFYLVGGSWRALGHLDMYLTQSALPGVHGYAFRRSRIKDLRLAIRETGPRLPRLVPGLSNSRMAGLDDAACLLADVGAGLGCDRLVVSTFGLREGLIFSELDPSAQQEDPLLAAVADYARRRGNVTWDGDRVADWIEPIFPGGDSALRRIRRAACHLAGVDLHPQSETRARHGMELAWLGGWIALDGAERAMLAQAMWTAWSGKGICPALDGQLADGDFAHAMRWGEAIRLAERLTGGRSATLDHASVTLCDDGEDGRFLRLAIDREWIDLGGEIITKQITALATAMGASAAIVQR